MFKNMKLGTKLLVAFLLVGVIPAAIIGVIALYEASTSLSQQAFNQLEGMRGVKKAQIEQFLAEREGDMGVLMETVSAMQSSAFSKLEAVQELKKHQLEEFFKTQYIQLHAVKDDPYVQRGLQRMSQAFMKGGIGEQDWQALAEQYDARLKTLMQEYGWYDLFLINSDGDIVYTATRESDLGMNLVTSELKDSSFGKAYAEAVTMDAASVAVGDFAPYAPSNGAFAAFMVVKIEGDLGDAEGYVAFQLPTAPINAIVQQRAGMGQTMETYLVGELDGVTA
ncbi:MAG: hypothetical protein GY731_09250, partial [Gammaproteobacteria bacterium]|nr:hypothetical protein [Gammaproteobacteria bacterium]